MYIRSQCLLFAQMANVCSGTKYGKRLTISGNNERNGCKITGKIVEIIGKILDHPELITISTMRMVACSRECDNNVTIKD